LPPAAALPDYSVTPTYYYNFVDFIFSAKCILLPYRLLLKKKKKKTTLQETFCFCFFCTFAPIFQFKLCSFCWQGCKNFSCPEHRL